MSQFMLEMCPANGHRCLYDDAFLASLSYQKATVSRADAPGRRPVET